MEDSEGNLWFGTDKSGIYKYDGVTFTNFTKKDGLNDNEVLTLFLDNKGNIWVGTRRGISIFKDENFTDFSEKHGLNKNDLIFSILEDHESNLWFGAYGGGIIKYTPSQLIHTEQGENDEFNGSFITFTSKDGLHNDNVVLMVFDDTENLWIGTEKGIDKFSIEQYKETGKAAFKHYGKAEGFTGIECIHNSVCQDSKGNIWFGTLRGAIKYIAKNDRPNNIEPITHITNLRLFFEEIDWSTYTNKASNAARNINGLPIGLKLPYNKNHLTFNFVGISLVAPEKVRYQYKLEGFDETWSPATKATYATYSNLNPGEYTFNVKACNNDGLWNKEPETFSFEIASPFWQMGWFRISGFIAISLLIFATYQIRTYKVRKRNKQLEEINTKLNEQIYERERAEEAIKKRNTQLELVQQVQSNIPLNLDIEVILMSAAESIGKLFGFSKVSMNLYKEDTNEIEHIVGWNKLGTPTPKGHKQKLGVGLIGKAAQLKKTIVANDVSKEPSYVVYYQTETKAELVIPLLVQDHLVGVLDIQDIKQNVFTEEDISVLKPIANYISYLIEAKLVEEKIKASLREKEILLKEIHHRVKNNMQIISSLLSLQSRHIKDEQVIEMLKECKNRIQSMALVHENLYRSKDFTGINLSEHINSLAKGLYQSYNADSRNIEMKIKSEDVSLSIDLAIPCGLAVNELVSNSLKHAFPSTWKGKGKIEISLHATEDKEIELVIRDNGVGIPRNIDFRKTESLGLQLVSILVEDQLKGKVSLDRGKGTRFKIKFKGN